MDSSKADSDAGTLLSVKVMKEMLITAKDIARRDGHKTVAELILATMERSITRGYFRTRWDGEHVSGPPVFAFVDFGRWLVRCECGQHNYVDPDEPILFCARCGNGNSGLARPVIFPTAAERRVIGAALLRRPVVEHPLAKNAVEAARLARPKFPVLTRNWYPGQRIEHLLEMNSQYGV